MALQSLAGVVDSGEPILQVNLPGEKSKWSCRIPGKFITKSCISSGCSGNGNTPEEAVNSAWELIEHNTKELNTYLETYHGRKVKLVGYTFRDVKEYEIR